MPKPLQSFDRTPDTTAIQLPRAASAFFQITLLNSKDNEEWTHFYKVYYVCPLFKKGRKAMPVNRGVGMILYMMWPKS